LTEYKLPARKEGDIQKSICDYLKAKGYFFWREGNQRRVVNGRHCKSAFEINGKPDIFLFDGAMTIAIEVKTDKGKQSQSQKEFARMWEVEPIRVYRVVRSVNEVISMGL